MAFAFSRIYAHADVYTSSATVIHYYGQLSLLGIEIYPMFISDASKLPYA